MSIFGTGAPKMVIGDKAVNLDNVMVSREIDDKVIVNESVINRHKNIHEKGEHIKYTIDMNLYKETVAIRKYNEIRQYKKNKNIKFYRHRDGSAEVDNEGNPIDFYMQECTPYYLEEWTFKDKLRIVLISVDPVDFGSNTIDSTLQSEDGETIITEDGTTIQV